MPRFAPRLRDSAVPCLARDRQDVAAHRRAFMRSGSFFCAARIQHCAASDQVGMIHQIGGAESLRLCSRILPWGQTSFDESREQKRLSKALWLARHHVSCMTSVLRLHGVIRAWRRRRERAHACVARTTCTARGGKRNMGARCP